MRCILGAGTAVNLDTLSQELAVLQATGIDTADLWIDRRAHLIWPFHRMLDGAEEDRRRGRVRGDGEAMGTTRRGIGPVYGDKHSYNGIRAGDLLDLDGLRRQLDLVMPVQNGRLAFYGLDSLRIDDLLEQAIPRRREHGSRIADTLPWVRDAVRAGRHILLEGQQGIGRDINWGIYPYTTASSPTAAGACEGAGIPPRAMDEVLGGARPTQPRWAADPSRQS